MPKYILCPRCDLNYILEGEKYCDVCKAELKIGPQLMFSVEDEEKEKTLCPICKQRYIEEDEEMCENCKEELSYEETDEETDEGWRQFLDEDEKDIISNKGTEEEMISLSQIEEEEGLQEDEDEDIDDYTNEKIYNRKDDDDLDFDIGPVDAADFEEEDEEDEDEVSDEEDDY